MKSTPTARWAGSHPTSTRANGHNTSNNNRQPSQHPVHKTRPGQYRLIMLSRTINSPLDRLNPLTAVSLGGINELVKCFCGGRGSRGLLTGVNA